MLRHTGSQSKALRTGLGLSEDTGLSQLSDLCLTFLERPIVYGHHNSIVEPTVDKSMDKVEMIVGRICNAIIVDVKIGSLMELCEPDAH